MGDLLGLLKGALVNYVVRNVKKMVPRLRPAGRGALQRRASPQGTRATLKPRRRSSPTTWRCCSTPAAPPACQQGRGAAAPQRDRQRAAVRGLEPAGDEEDAGRRAAHHASARCRCTTSSRFTTNMMLSMRMGGCNDPDPEPARPAGGAQGAVQAQVPQLPGGQHAVQRRWPTTRTSTRSTGATSRSRSAAAWRCRARSRSCGWRRPAARSARATACRRPRPSASCNPVTSTAFTGTIGVPLPQHRDEAARRRRPRSAAGPARRDRHQGPAGDGRLLAAPRRDRQGHDAPTASSAAATSASWTSAATSRSSTARRT